MWFAWKSVPLWYLKQPSRDLRIKFFVVICLKICTFVVSKTTLLHDIYGHSRLWFAWKSVPLWYLKQQFETLKSRYRVVICLKICTFVVSKTTNFKSHSEDKQLWFAWKSVPLWYLKQRFRTKTNLFTCCDLLENLYLCGI